MKLTKNQSGLTTVETILLVLVVITIAVVGWLAYDKKIKDQGDSVDTSSQQIPEGITNTEQ